MIACGEAVRLMWQYLDGNVAVDERVLVEEHLARCRTCCAELEFVRELQACLAGAAADDLPPGVLRRLTDALEGLGHEGLGHES